MRITIISYKIASWVLLIGGAGHALSEIAAPKAPGLDDLIIKMKEFTLQVVGDDINMYSFHQGFSIMMGLLLFGYGTLNLLIAKNNERPCLPKNILVLNILITLTSLLLSMKFFFIVPTFLIGLAFLGFLISILTIKKAK